MMLTGKTGSQYGFAASAVEDDFRRAALHRKSVRNPTEEGSRSRPRLRDMIAASSP